MSASWILAAAGDIGVDRPDPMTVFEHLSPVLNTADIAVANLEVPFTTRTVGAHGMPIASDPKNARCLPPAGFDLIVLANNHTGNCGSEGLMETVDTLKELGLKTVGAGPNIRAARAATIMDAGGLKVAFLAFTNLYVPGDVADDNHPGVAVLRSHSYYYFSEVWSASGVVIPGADPKVGTVPYPQDIEMLSKCIADARAQADVVVLSLHSGISTNKGRLCDYERLYAKAAIDAGADMVFGHHHHMLRGMEYYKGKPILYGLGTLVLDLPKVFANSSEAELAKLRKSDNPYAMYPRDGYPLVPPFHGDCRYTAVAVCEFSGASVSRVSVLPCYISDDGKPIPQALDSDLGQRCMAYLKEVTAIAELNVEFADGGSKIAGYNTLVMKEVPRST